jgi:hypothetical protein
MVLYGIDALMFLLIKDWLSIGFHALALYGFFKAIGAIKKLRKLDEAAVNREE